MKKNLDNKSIPSGLLAEIKHEDRKRFIQDYLEANFVLDVMKEAIERQLNYLYDKEEKIEMFEKPGYVAEYAYLMGQRKMAKQILNLFPKKG